MAAFALLQWVYLQTSRELQRLEVGAPIFLALIVWRFDAGSEGTVLA